MDARVSALRPIPDESGHRKLLAKKPAYVHVSRGASEDIYDVGTEDIGYNKPAGDRYKTENPFENGRDHPFAVPVSSSLKIQK